MPTPFSLRSSFPAPVADVVAMLQDASFRDRVLADQKPTTRHAGVSRVSGVLTVRLEITEDIGQGTLQRLIGTDRLRIVITEAWTGPASAELTMTADGLPLTLTGTQRLVETASATELTAEGTVGYKKLLLGRFAEKFVAEDLLGELYETQQRLGEQWLAERSNRPD